MTDRLYQEAERTIMAGSKSFAAAARLFDPPTRRSALLLYAWCRHCDDVVDGQQMGHFGPAGLAGHHRAAHREPPVARLARLEAATRRTLAGDPPDEPVFIGLGEVVARHGIPAREPLEHLAGFRMDVEGCRYRTLADLTVYCQRVAGVVGLMMARVMGQEDEDTLDRAADLGIAFQMTNIARDVVEDAAVGRVYLPLDWLDAVGLEPGAVGAPRNRVALAAVVAALLDAAEPYYGSSLAGIARLPPRSAAAVATARRVYRAIGLKVRAAGPGAWDWRIATSRGEKLRHAGIGLVTAATVRLRQPAPRDPGLWTRPR